MAELAELFGYFLLSGVKFLPCPFLIVGRGYDFWISVSVTMGGGTLGVLFFYNMSEMLMERARRKGLERIRVLKEKGKYVPKPKFTRFNKTIVKVKKRFGVFGIALLTPPILSIPVGSVIAAKFFRHKNYTLYVLIGAVVFWGFALSYIGAFFGSL